MLKRKIMSLMVLIMSAGLILAACGEDGGGETPTNNGESDAGGDIGGDDDAGEDQGCTTDDQCAAGMSCDTTTGLCVNAPSGCELTGADRPERCDKDVAGTTFGPGSVVTSFQVAGLLPDGTPECCFDYDSSQDDGDSDIDNALGALLFDFDQLESINEGLTASISDGDLLLMFEHDGLTDLSSTDSYGLNFWLGELGQTAFVSTGPGVDCTDDTNCGDAACESTSLCVTPGEICDSTVDDDGDGDIDCADDDCLNNVACEGTEVCDSGSDEDGDGDVDCADTDCAGTQTCTPPGEDCSTTDDEDGDGDAGCADSDCFGAAACQHGNPLTIDPSSVDSGTFPHARVQNAVIDGDSLTAGPGTVRLDIEVLETPLSLTISQAKITADVDSSMSSIEDGVWMTNGRLGGVVRLDDVLHALNGFAETSCGCLELEGDPLVTYDPDNVGCYRDDVDLDGTYEGKDCQCNVVTADANACEAAGESTCATIASNCGLVYGALPSVADVDTDGDGINDAISIGATFETVGANITGITGQ
jgi:hypothetical protein